MKKELYYIFLLWFFLSCLGGFIVCKISFPIIIKTIFVYHDKKNIIEYTIQNRRNYVQKVKLILLKINSKNRNVYIYYDPNYELFEIDKQKVLAIINFLKTEFRIRRYLSQIEIINADNLKKFLLDNDTPKSSILIVPTGAFPNNIYSIYHNLVKPWVKKGGILIWTTSCFGYYSAFKKDSLLRNSLHPQKLGEIYFWGTNIINYQSRYEKGIFKSKIGAILSLEYPFLYRGVNIKKEKLLNGKTLGYIQNSTTSVGVIPLGEGKIIIFGGFIPRIKYSHVIAIDISKIISSGVLNGDIKVYKKYKLAPYESINDKIILPAKDEYLLYIFQDSEEASFYERIYIKGR